MAGLIDTQINPIEPLKSIAGYDAELSEVDPITGTVAGQMDTLLSKESPYITRARTSAAQIANSRGLLNSSMAAGAGEAAAIDAALPSAGQAANIFNTTRLTNQAATNRGFEFTAGSQNQGALTAFQANKALESQRLSGTQALEQISAGGTQTRLNIGAQTAGSQQLQQQQATLQAGTIIPAQTAAQSQLMLQEFQQQNTLNAAEFAQQKAQTILQGEIESGLITTREQAEARLAQLQGEIQASLIGTQTAAQSQLLYQEFTQQTQLNVAEFSQQKAMTLLQGDIQKGLITTEAQFRERLAQLQGQIQGALMFQEFTQQRTLNLDQFAQQKAQTILQGEIEKGLITTQEQSK